MTIPFFDLKRQYEEIADEVENTVIEVMRSTQYIEGMATKELEKKLADYIGVKHAITCGNGTDALQIALRAVGVKEGDEVITTAFSFFATPEAISQIGATPVFADINEKTLNIDCSCIERLITKKTKAILPVHIFGLPVDMDELNEIAERYGIPVVEDACQAIGSLYKGAKAGSLGKVGCFSFYPTKNLGGMGDGGMITTNDDNLAKICRALKAHAAGKIGAEAYSALFGEKVEELENMKKSDNGLYDPCKYFNYFTGGNSRLDSMQAAVLNVKLKRLDEYNRRREAIAKRYTEGLKGLPIEVPKTEYEDRKSCWHQYAILCDRKNELIEFLDTKQIGSGAFYPVPLHLQKAFEKLSYQEGNLKIAESVCKRSVCLPIFPELTEDEVDYIINSIKEFF